MPERFDLPGIAELGPAKRRPYTLFGSLRGSIKISGDIISPLDEEWDALARASYWIPTR